MAPLTWLHLDGLNSGDIMHCAIHQENKEVFKLSSGTRRISKSDLTVTKAKRQHRNRTQHMLRVKPFRGPSAEPLPM
jgi:hypothetical protein